jgi:hypothetical protein
MIFCRENKFVAAILWLGLAFSAIQRLNAAVGSQLNVAEVAPRPMGGKPDLDPEKTLAALLGTNKTHCSDQGFIDHNLRSKIASFAAPKSSHECPVDFLTHTTVIPEEWGMVHDMHRDEQGNLKILTVRKIPNSDAMLGERIVVGSLLAGLMSSKLLLATSAFFVGLLQLTKYLGYYDCQISIYDLSTKTLESTSEGVYKYPDLLCYFLANTKTIEIRHAQGMRTFRRLSLTSDFADIEIPRDPVSQAIRAEREAHWVSRKVSLQDGDGIFAWERRCAISSLLLEATHLRRSLNLWINRNVFGDHPPYYAFDTLQPETRNYCNELIKRHVLFDGARQLTKRTWNAATKAWDTLEMMHLPRLTDMAIVAAFKTEDSTAVMFHMGKQYKTAIPFSNDTARKTFVLDFNTKQLSPQFQIMLETMIKSKSTAGFDAPHRHKFSLNMFSPLWRQRMVENLRLFCGVDAAQVTTEREQATREQRRKERFSKIYAICLPCVQVGSVALGAWLLAKHPWRQK